ncbi:SIMPL domain-containing protein [Agrobacterium rhizogenes]|uniref:SIMPL domain-containing protein n=1 Tax=Rhizobium rhizogenes TaxID=359 RepID=UPI001574D1D4|nr:SIMPL domain-containing protein [Rhizobium rhizogenes]NTI16305.1 SIMPL domain-containing protein [Rhizobium rhizogenes]
MPMTKTGDFILAALFSATLLVPATQAFAEDAKPREAIITVTGEGHSAIAPDMAIVTLSVVKQEKAAQDALDQNNKAMGAVLATLKDSGIAARDLQTSGFSIQPQYVYPNDKDGQSQPPTLTGYQVNNGLTVRVRDLSKLGTLLDQVVKLGINQGGDIQFTNDKPDTALEEARKNAVADATAKAKTLSEAAGVKLGRVISISEGAIMAPPQPYMRQAMAKASADSSVPVASGENTYNASVSITYAIQQ